MKRFVLLVVAAFLVATNVYAIGPTYSGSWYNPAQSGHGFSLEYTVLKDGTPVVVAYWYVYDSEGNPIFLIGNGEPGQGNTVTLEFEAPYGMKFGEFDPESTVRADGGTGVFTFEDSEAGVFDYEPSQWMKDTYGVSAVSIPVVQLLEVAHPTSEPPCSEPGSLTGMWSGKMVYDRAYMGDDVCYDANVTLRIEPDDEFGEIVSITVNRDDGGQEIYLPYTTHLSSDCYVADTFRLFDGRTDYSLQFNTQGYADGVWTEFFDECSGLWSFTKD
jgi:hypothetical protein